jgi:hypothetical protein
MRERAEASTIKLWLLLGADRRLVSLGFVSALFFGVVAGGLAHPTPAAELVADGDPVETLAQALITSTVTGVTLVLTLSQLVLSQEQGAVGDQRERMEEAMAFREDVAAMLDQPVSPAEPSGFLRAMVRATERRAEELEAAVGSDAAIADQLSAFVQGLKANSSSVRDRLDSATFGEFEVVRAALDYNYSWKLYVSRRLQAEHAGELTEAADEAFDALAESLELFGPAREHFKTLYFQWELIDLSRTILWVSIPSLLVSTWALVFFDADAFPGGLLGVPYSLLQVAAAVAIAVLPFAVLLAYILRIVTVTKRTLSIGPFILRETDRDVEFDR